MVVFNKNLNFLKKDPVTLFKINNFFDQDLYLDIKKLFYKEDSDELKLSVGFSMLGKKSIHPSKHNFNNENQQKTITKLNEILHSKDFFYFMIKNKGSMWPHVDAQRKYASLMLYFPDEDEKEIEYGTTFWESNTPNFSNKHIIDQDKVNNFKNENKVLYKFPFVPNCMYGFIRNNFSWHTVEPIDVSSNYIRKSINIYFIYNN